MFSKRVVGNFHADLDLYQYDSYHMSIQSFQMLWSKIIRGEASPTFGHANFFVFLDRTRNQFLKK